jgi:hypothetical protein
MTAPAAAARSAPKAARQRNHTLPISAAQPGSQRRPARAERSEPHSGALDGPAKRSYPDNHRPAPSLKRWVE